MKLEFQARVVGFKLAHHILLAIAAVGHGDAQLVGHDANAGDVSASASRPLFDPFSYEFFIPRLIACSQCASEPIGGEAAVFIANDSITAAAVDLNRGATFHILKVQRHGL